VGVGTSSPGLTLDVYNATSSIIRALGDSTVQINAARYSTDTSAASLVIRKFRGTVASPSAVASGDTAGSITFQAYGGTNNRAVAQIISSVDTYVSDTNISGSLAFYTNIGSTGTTERLRIDSSGNIYPTTTPSSAWGLAGFGYSAPISLANDATYDFAAGSGLIIIISAGNTVAGAMLFAAVGSVAIISDPQSEFSSVVNTANKFNVYYESAVGKYRLQNKQGATESLIYIATLAARPAA